MVAVDDNLIATTPANLGKFLLFVMLYICYKINRRKEM